MKKFYFIAALLALFVNSIFAETLLEIGDKAPEFNLVDASGNEIRLSNFKGKKNVVLVFYDQYS